VRKKNKDKKHGVALIVIFEGSANPYWPTRCNKFRLAGSPGNDRNTSPRKKCTFLYEIYYERGDSAKTLFLISDFGSHQYAPRGEKRKRTKNTALT
jgi:hypothetical protein